MKLTVTRFDHGKYETVIMRDDGVSYRLKGVAHMFAIPHDLAHFLVEKTLHLDRGFFGSIAGGAVFKTMDYIGGRRKPKAAEQSEKLLRDNAAPLNEAEALVRIFNDTIEQGHTQTSPLLRERLRGRLIRPGLQRSFSDAEIAEVYTAYREMLQKWEKLPVGGAMQLRW
jgi:hypothetical protein